MGGSDVKAVKARQSESGKTKILKIRDRCGRRRNRAKATVNLLGNSGQSTRDVRSGGRTWSDSQRCYVIVDIATTTFRRFLGTTC